MEKRGSHDDGEEEEVKHIPYNLSKKYIQSCEQAKDTIWPNYHDIFSYAINTKDISIKTCN